MDTEVVRKYLEGMRQNVLRRGFSPKLHPLVPTPPGYVGPTCFLGNAPGYNNEANEYLRPFIPAPAGQEGWNTQYSSMSLEEAGVTTQVALDVIDRALLALPPGTARSLEQRREANEAAGFSPRKLVNTVEAEHVA